MVLNKLQNHRGEDATNSGLTLLQNQMLLQYRVIKTSMNPQQTDRRENATLLKCNDYSQKCRVIITEISIFRTDRQTNLKTIIRTKKTATKN